MAKLSTLPLDELYSKPKKTRAVEIAIINQSDFTSHNERYCENICKIKCKKPNEVRLANQEVDILIIQDHRNPPGKFDRQEGQQDQIVNNVINHVCVQAGMQGLKYRLVSLLKCAATDVDFPSGKPPTQTTLQKCFPYLHQEILNCKPKVIISLGTATTKSLGLTKHSNTGNRGEVAFSQYGPVILTLHPRILTYIRQNARGAAGMWGPDYLRVIQRDFEKACKIARGEWKPTPYTLKETVQKLKESGRIRIARSLSDVKEIMDEIWALDPRVVVSFDTETTSLDPLDPKLKLLTIQFGWRDKDTGILKSGVIPLWHRKNNFLDPDAAWALIEPFLLSDRPKVGHNAKYDILVIYWSKGIRVNNVAFDTLLMLHSIESGAQGTYGLKTATWDFLYEEGFAGYEESLGDLKKLKKQIEAMQGDTQEEVIDGE
jgi:uracil-DNA glycosylase family 4